MRRKIGDIVFINHDMPSIGLMAGAPGEIVFVYGDHDDSQTTFPGSGIEVYEVQFIPHDGFPTDKMVYSTELIENLQIRLLEFTIKQNSRNRS